MHGAHPSARAQAGARPFEESWREEIERIQSAVLPSGRITLTCSAARGDGGLGRHLDEILRAAARAGARATCISAGQQPPPVRAYPWRALPAAAVSRALRAPLIPASPGLRTWAFMLEFDAQAARRIAPAEHLIAFNSQALAQFRVAARMGFDSLGLVSANPHIRHLAHQHELAHRRYPLEDSWARYLIERNIAEYARAQSIYVGSRYTAETFSEHGVAEERLVRFPFTPDPRYRRREHAHTREEFEILYVGRLAVHKGVPLLIDAFRRLPHRDMRLTLVGGWATRGMRRFVEQARAADARISVGPGDPLPRLRDASLCVHPTYEDGFAYAPAEALACGVPLIVSEDTGMKELIDDPRRGLILPTGDLDALTEAIDAAYRREILVG
jgi:glycosyltransferase involved in cell wall biosynthesis